jgi:phenylacetate-CoA ligase
MNNNFIESALKSPFYKRMLENVNLNDWNSIPFTTKEQLRNADSFDLLGVSLEQVATYHETSGTTGTPTSSWYSHQDIKQEADVILNSNLHLKEDDIVLNRFPFAMAIPSFIVYWACHEIGATHIGADKASLVTPDKRIVEIINRTSPTILAMLPSEAEKINQTAIQMGVSFPIKGLRALLLAGELVSPSRKKYLEETWGVPVYLFFGSTETGGLFMTCEYGNYHLDHPNVKIEVVDDEGNLVANGKSGNAILSTAREGMPLLRYYNNDVIELRDGDSCKCGNLHPVMIHYGRKDDMVIFNSLKLSFYELQEVVYSLSTVPFMWKVKADYNKILFIFQYVQDHSLSFTDIKEELKFKLGIPVQLEFNEIIPLTQLTEIPAYSKYAHIEHEMAGSK